MKFQRPTDVHTNVLQDNCVLLSFFRQNETFKYRLDRDKETASSVKNLDKPQKNQSRSAGTAGPAGPRHTNRSVRSYPELHRKLKTTARN